MIATTRTLGAIAMVLFACTAQAAQSVYGTTDAQICYESATVGPRTQDIDICTAAIKKSELNRTDLAATYSNRGILLVARGDLDAALSDQNKAIDLDPTARAYVNRANIHYRQQRYDAAIADYGQAEALSEGKFATVFYNRALAHRAIGDANAARADIERAVALAPENPAYRDVLTALQ